MKEICALDEMISTFNMKAAAKFVIELINKLNSDRGKEFGNFYIVRGRQMEMTENSLEVYRLFDQYSYLKCFSYKAKFGECMDFYILYDDLNRKYSVECKSWICNSIIDSSNTFSCFTDVLYFIHCKIFQNNSPYEFIKTEFIDKLIKIAYNH